MTAAASNASGSVVILGRSQEPGAGSQEKCKGLSAKALPLTTSNQQLATSFYGVNDAADRKTGATKTWP
jgi:hypothetical protein